MNDLQPRPAGLTASQVDYILLDGSSSMLDKWFESLEAIDQYVGGCIAAKLRSHVFLATFDPVDMDCIQRDCGLDTWTPLSEAPIGSHGGMTPLYDAINIMARRLRDLDPSRASVVIVTDGEENASTYTSLVQAKALLDWMRAKGWQITFIGADFSNAQQAALLGGDRQSAIGVQKKLLGAAGASLAEKRTRYGLYGTPMHFSEDEQQQFGGYLNAPSAPKES